MAISSVCWKSEPTMYVCIIWKRVNNACGLSAKQDKRGTMQCDKTRYLYHVCHPKANNSFPCTHSE